MAATVAYILFAMRRGVRAAASRPILSAIVVVCAIAAGPAAASASLPPYEGTTSFPPIHGPSDSGEYSWEVKLAPNQELELVDPHNAEVYYVEDHHPAFGITAESAHDAEGANVPTTLTVPAANVITLTVHHRAGNPMAGGDPFAYPVSAGPFVKISEGTVVVSGPADEQELREARERIEKANPPADTSGPSGPAGVRDRSSSCGRVDGVLIHAHRLRCGTALRVYRADRRGKLPNGWVCSASLARCYRGKLGSPHFFWWKRTIY
jgi:hypothetical protein